MSTERNNATIQQFTHSVKIETTAKGLAQISVHVYSNSKEEMKLDAVHLYLSTIADLKKRRENSRVRDMSEDCDECSHSQLAHGIGNECVQLGRHMKDHDCFATGICSGCDTCSKEHLECGEWAHFITVCKNCQAEYSNEDAEAEICINCNSSNFEEHELCSCEHWISG